MKPIQPFTFIEQNPIIKPIRFLDYNKPRVGEIHKNIYNEEYMIIDYNGHRNMTIQFLDNYGYTKNHVSTSHINNGYVKNMYRKNIYNGYFGEGYYNAIYYPKEYTAWQHMLERHMEINQGDTKLSSYVNSTVCDEWYNYQNFAHWYHTYMWGLNKQVNYELDKDILQWGLKNKIYSPSTCCIVPHEINQALVGCAYKIRNRDMLPTGVIKEPNFKKDTYRASIRRYNKLYIIGHYKTPEEAFEAYKSEKQKHIRELADHYYSINALKRDVYEKLCNISINPFY